MLPAAREGTHDPGLAHPTRTHGARRAHGPTRRTHVTRECRAARYIPPGWRCMFALHLPSLGIGSMLHTHSLPAYHGTLHDAAFVRQRCCAHAAHRASQRTRSPTAQLAHKPGHMPSLGMHHIHMLHSTTWHAAWHEHCMDRTSIARAAPSAAPGSALLRPRATMPHALGHTLPLAKPRTPSLLTGFVPRVTRK